MIARLVDENDKLDSMELVKEIFAITKIGKVNLKSKLDKALEGE
jgi:hypothetical protein